jgi:hypothetical protein
MGFFSWKCSNNNKPIRNRHTAEGATECKMLIPGGKEFVECAYDGYGTFCGQDFYEMVDKLNGGDGTDRDRGINIGLSRKPGLILPKLVSIRCRQKWEDLPDSREDPDQGYW